MIIDIALEQNINVLTLPPVNKILNGDLSPAQIKQVRIEDLLERAPIHISNEKLFLGKSLTQFEDHVKGVREATRDVEVTLPTNPSATTLGSRSKIIVINVNRDGSYMVGARAMKLDQIEILLEKAVQKDPDQKVLVRADGDALNRYVNGAVITARAAGVREVKQQLQ